MDWAILCGFGSLAVSATISRRHKRSWMACFLPISWLTEAMTVMISWLLSLSIRLLRLFHRVATVNNYVIMTAISTVNAIWLSAFSTKSSTIVACFPALTNSLHAILAFSISSRPFFGFADLSTQPRKLSPISIIHQTYKSSGAGLEHLL